MYVIHVLQMHFVRVFPTPIIWIARFSLPLPRKKWTSLDVPKTSWQVFYFIMCYTEKPTNGKYTWSAPGVHLFGWLLYNTIFLLYP